MFTVGLIVCVWCVVKSVSGQSAVERILELKIKPALSSARNSDVLEKEKEKLLLFAVDDRVSETWLEVGEATLTLKY